MANTKTVRFFLELLKMREADNNLNILVKICDLGRDRVLLFEKTLSKGWIVRKETINSQIDSFYYILRMVESIRKNH